VRAVVISDKQLLPGQLKQILGVEGNGWQVVWVRDLHEVPSQADNQSVIVVDSESYASGLCGHFKELQKSLGYNNAPILLVGGKAQEREIHKVLALGASGYLLRPLEAEEVRRKVREVVQPVGTQTNLDVKVINPFIEAATEVFRTASGMEIVRKDLFLKKNYRMFGDVSGVMGLNGEASGTVVISMSAQLACKLVGRMLGEEPESTVSATVRDGVGEVINMIAGRAKAVLAGSQYHFHISLPAVIAGTGHEIAHKSGAPCIVVVFGVEDDEFAIQVSLAPEE
jgi:chemotaxis protein CheX